MAYYEHKDNNGNKYYLNDKEEAERNEESRRNGCGCFAAIIAMGIIGGIGEWIFGDMNTFTVILGFIVGFIAYAGVKKLLE